MTQVTPVSGNALHADQSKVFCKESTLADIFGAGVQPGRALVDAIIRVYKASCSDKLAVA